jgi:hypothetical protein
MNTETITVCGQQFEVVYEKTRTIRVDNPSLHVIGYNPGARKNKTDRRYRILRDDVVGKNNRIEDAVKAVRYKNKAGEDLLELYDGVRRYTVAKDLGIPTLQVQVVRAVHQEQAEDLINTLFRAHNKSGLVAAHTAAENLGTVLRGGEDVAVTTQSKTVARIVWALGLPDWLLKKGKDGFLSPSAVKTAVKAAGILVGAFPRNIEDATRLQLETAREVLVYMEETNSTLGVQNWSRGESPNPKTLQDGLKTRMQMRQTDRGVRLCNPEDPVNSDEE